MVSSRRTETPSRTLNRDMEAEKKAPPTVPAEAARLRIVGAWSGFLEVQLESWTLPMLRSEVAERSGVSSDCIRLICGGRVLRDGDGPALPLPVLGLKNNSKVLATVVSPDIRNAHNAAAAAAAKHSQKLARIWDSASAFTEIHAEGISFFKSDHNMKSGYQIVPAVEFGSVADHRALTMSAMLHKFAKGFIRRRHYKDALDVLSMAEVALSLCDPKIAEVLLEVLILELDIVWCYFMLWDISCLSVAGARLAKVRRGLGSSRHAELAIYMRLDLLEGVVAYHSGNFVESRKALSSAQAKYAQLQVPDEALPLPMTGQDKCAVDFQVEEQANKIHRYQDDIQRREAIMEQKISGKIPQNTAVNLERLNKLVSIGFERDLAAEALQRNENDTHKALDDLTDPEKSGDLQHRIELRKKVKAPGPIDADFGELLAIGCNRSADHHNNDEEFDALTALSKAASRIANQQADTDPPTQGQASDPPTRDQEGPLEAAAATAGRVDEQRHTAAIEDEKPDAEALECEVLEEPTRSRSLEPGFLVKFVGEAIAQYLALLDYVADESKGSR